MFTSPVQVAFSKGGKPAGSTIVPLALPSESVVTLLLNAEGELPATPVKRRSGLTQRLISLPSRNTEIVVFGFILLTTNLIGTLLAKNCTAEETLFPLTVLDWTPLATSLFCGLILEELLTAAAVTEEIAASLFSPPSELIDVKDGEEPTQFTMNELCKEEKLSFTSTFAKKIL